MDLLIGRPMVIESLELVLTSAAELQMVGTLQSATAQDQASRHLVALHNHILTQQLRSFTVDIRKLKFANSSAIRLFVDWISRAATARYKLVFLTDRTITWHRLSFSVLKSLAPTSVEIQ
jgi:hypothetical protein